MSKRTPRHTLVALALAAVLALLPAAAQAAPFAAHHTPEFNLSAGLNRLFSWFYRLFQNVSGAEGVSIDPDGLRATGAPEGVSIDPNGLAVTPGDEGPSLDPNGLAVRGDEGGSLDPNG